MQIINGKIEKENTFYILKSDDHIQNILDNGKSLIMLDPEIVYNLNNIIIPSNVTIIGNGATIKSTSTEHEIFKIAENATNVRLSNINFKGITIEANVDNAAMITTDIAILIKESLDIKIENCSFENFLGAAIKDIGAVGDSSLKLTKHFITNNDITRCYMGIVSIIESEYNIFSTNRISYCRIGIWAQAGNNNFNGNTIVRCRAAFVSTADVNTMVTEKGINRDHGSVVGNIFNHCKRDQTDVGWKTANYLINTIDYYGVWIDGFDFTYPPTFIGNTMYFTDLTYLNSEVSGIPYWYIVGCIFSNMIVICNAMHKVGLIGCTEQANVTKTNIDHPQSIPSSWVTPTLINNWTAKSGFTVRYKKDTNGMVYLRGIVESGSADTIAFVLPTGFRPTGQNSFFSSYNSASIGKIMVDVDGNVKIVTFDTYASLDMVFFNTI